MSAEGKACRHYRARRRPTGIRLLVVDDHDGVRTALSQLFADEDDLTVVGQCTDGSEVVEAAARLRPDVVVMDLSMPGVDGLAATRALVDVQPEAKVLILTSQGVGARPAALAAGARGLATKSLRSDRLLCCVQSVAVGCSCCLEDASATA